MKKKIYVLLVLMVALLGFNVQAKTDNAFYAEDNLSLSKSINTTSFFAGNNVDVTSTIDGMSFVAGNNVNLSSTQDYMFAAGNTMTLKNVKVKDAFIAGNIITIYDSEIRDLFAAGSSITLNSKISRDAYLAGETITINGTIDGNVKISAETINIGENAVITGKVRYPEEATINIAGTAKVGLQETYKSDSVDIDLEVSPIVIIMDSVKSYLSYLLIGIILIALNKNVFEKIEEEEKNASAVLINALKGFGFLVLVPIASLIIMITTIGFPLALICLLMYGILVYLAQLSSVYFIGNWILKDKISNKYLLFTVSLLVLYIIKFIPVAGGLISFATMCLGLGIYTNLLMKIIKSNK